MWPLAVLYRSVEYKNLTAASQHIGLSQPQLSRLVQKLEKDLKLQLLDRSSRRHTAWTPVAQKLAEAYSQSHQKLIHSISQLQDDSVPRTLSIGTLEGLAPLALAFARRIFNSSPVLQLSLNVLDLNDLEAQFQAAELDIVWTSRSPGKKKYPRQILRGYQKFEVYNSESVQVLSPFELSRQKRSKRKSPIRQIISNSLWVRRQWLENEGGQGQVPGPVHQKEMPGEVPVLILGQDHLHSSFWQKVLEE